MKDLQGDSATFSVLDVNGFNVLYTVRAGDEKSFSDRVKATSEQLKIDGYKPQAPKSFGGGFVKKEKEWTGEICPKDGGRLYYLITKTGKDMCKCEKSTYLNGVAGGCDFVAWGKNLADASQKKAEWTKAKAQAKTTPITADEYYGDETH